MAGTRNVAEAQAGSEDAREARAIVGSHLNPMRPASTKAGPCDGLAGIATRLLLLIRGADAEVLAYGSVGTMEEAARPRGEPQTNVVIVVAGTVYVK